MMTILWKVSTFTLSHVILLYMVSRVACDCPTPPVYADKTHSNYNSSYSTGAQATYQCAPGYINPSGQTISTCQSDGSWTQVTLQCERGSCSNPGTPYNGTRSGDDFRVSKHVNFSCDEGYRLIGDTISTCMVDQTWSNSVPTCDAITCAGLQAPKDGGISHPGEARYNDVVTISCNRGKMYLGQSSTRRCTENGWTGNEGTCIDIDCGSPTLYNGRVEALDGTGLNKKITYSCDNGTMREESQDLKDTGGYSWCFHTGKWVPSPPTCNLACGRDVPDVTHGFIDVSGSTFYPQNTELNITCKSRYTHAGADRHVVCRNGTWTPSVDLTCELSQLVENTVIGSLLLVLGLFIGMLIGPKICRTRSDTYLQETKCDALCLEVDRIIDTLPETYHQKTSRFVRSIFMELRTLIKSVVIIDKKGNENIVNEFLKNIDSLKDGDEDQDCRDMLNLIVDDLKWVIKEDCAEYMHGRNLAWQEKKRDIEDKCRADQNMSTDHIICDMQYFHGMERIHDALTQYVINYHPRGLIYDDPALTTCWERCCRLGLFPCYDNTATIKMKPEQTRREDIMLQPTNV